jgi:putative ABC transport system ATP-binding protein
MPHSVSSKQPLVVISGLSKHYQEGTRQRRVFDDLNVVFNRHEIIALLGRSGSGKSTLLNLISGIDVPDRGEVSIDNHPIHALDENARTRYRRHHIGFVFQAYNLIPTLSVSENVQVPLEMTGHSAADARRMAQSMLTRVGLQGRAETFPEHLSGGEQQRVAIARAIVHAPELILADEPTGNLDQETGNQVLALLQSLVRDSNATMIMVTHSDDVAAIADRRLVINNGQLLEQTPR